LQEALYILHKYWGYSKFRPLQEPIISTLLEKKDVIALLPTGGGKSICFQVPALMQDGICLVVSPLIALMEDQVNALKQKGIKAMALTSGMSFDELDKSLDNCIYGNYKFLYLSPERLQQEIVQERIKQMNLNLIAIDEAHCISQWGHDFRPAYRNLLVLRELQPHIPVVALTATATAKVARDIELQLQLHQVSIFNKSFFRPNIAYNVLKTEDKLYRLSQLLKNKKETAIVYLRTRKATVEISEYLNKKGYKAAAFHGGLPSKEKSAKLNEWLNDEIYIMVATTAFGMGIDKPDVRQVVHFNLPESLESYFQEAGRAGRDEKPALATIITNESDIPMLKNQFLATLPEIEDVKLVYKKLTSYFRIAYGEGENTKHDFNFSHFCDHYQLNSFTTYNVLQLLDRCSIIKLSQQFQKKAALQFIIPNGRLEYYLKENQKYENLVKAILRTYGGIFENKIPVNLFSVCKKVGVSEQQALLILQKLHQDEIIDFEYSRHDASVTFLVPREDDISIHPFSEFIQQQNNTKKRNISSVLSYIRNDKICRSKQLLEYFGETKVKACGICSVCKAENSELTKAGMNEIYREISRILEQTPKSSRNLTEEIIYPEEHVLKVLQLLTDKKIIQRTITNTYKLTRK